MREEMILSRLLKTERMLTLHEIANDVSRKLVAAGFKHPPSHDEIFADCSVLDPIREKPGLHDRA
jgi:hypothetical protein